MTKVIIGIHGLGNKPPRQLLEKWWKDSILEGFKRADIRPPHFKFEMVYWSDLIYKYPKNINITDKEDPYFLEEPYTPYSNNIRNQTKKDLSFRKKTLQFMERQMEKVFLNDDFTMNYSFISEVILRKYFKEMDMYYDTDINQIEIKQNIYKRLLSVLKKYKYDDIILIGHSMGSIIAYDVLQFKIQNQNIHTLITIGSPLGLPYMRSKIAANLKEAHQDVNISTPNCISNAWINFADLEDKVALNFDLNNDFSPNKDGIQVTDFEVINDYEINGNINPHKAYGYLRSEEFTLYLNTLLNEKVSFSFKGFVRKIQKILHQIKYRLKLIE